MKARIGNSKVMLGLGVVLWMGSAAPGAREAGTAAKKTPVAAAVQPKADRKVKTAEEKAAATATAEKRALRLAAQVERQKSQDKGNDSLLHRMKAQVKSRREAMKAQGSPQKPVEAAGDKKGTGTK